MTIVALVTPTPTSTPVTHLTGLTASWLVGATIVLVILAGIVVLASRGILEGRSGGPKRAAEDKSVGAATSDRGRLSDRTIIRSWLAISLASGLLLFAAASFALDDTTLRSSLIGGVVATSGAAAAFYFASKSADQARSDILQASLPRIVMPNLRGKSFADIQALIASTPLQLLVPDPPPPAAASCLTQDPPASQVVPVNSTVNVTF